MKISRCIFRILWILPLTAVLIALPLLPEQIPAHYGIDGQVDRFGSKYETLIFPAITITFGLLMQGHSHNSRQTGKARDEQRKNRADRRYFCSFSLQCHDRILFIYRFCTGPSSDKCFVRYGKDPIPCFGYFHDRHRKFHAETSPQPDRRTQNSVEHEK